MYNVTLQKTGISNYMGGGYLSWRIHLPGMRKNAAHGLVGMNKELMWQIRFQRRQGNVPVVRYPCFEVR